MSQQIDPAAEAEALEEEGRPSGDFVDGYLAALANMNSALFGDGAPRRFYSFDWIGDAEEPREASLRAAFQDEQDALSFEVEHLRDWRADVEILARKWIAAGLPETAVGAVVGEFGELLDAFWGDQPVEAFSVRPSEAKGVGDGDYVLFESIEGRLFLEFSTDA